MQSTPESGERAGWDGAKRRKGSRVHASVDTLEHLLTLHGTPANQQDRDQVGELAAAVQDTTGETVEVAYVDQGHTGQSAADAFAERGIALEVVKLHEAKHGSVLVSPRCVVKRDFVWMSYFRPL